MTQAPASIALFLPHLGGGGAERNFVRLAAALAHAGHSVVVVVGTAAGPNRDWVPPGLPLVDLRASRLVTAILPLARFLRERQPGVLLSALDDANLIALAACRIAGVGTPIVVTSRIATSASEAHASGLRARFVIPWLIRRYYRHADAIVAVSRGAAADLADVLGMERTCVIPIPNPVVTDRLRTLQTEPVSHPWLDAHAPAPLVVAVGRLAIQKDYPLLLKAFAQVRRVIPNAALAILGEGEERAKLEKLRADLGLEDAVLLAGFQANPYAWMRRADVVALSSRFEGLPTVLIEALACGARVVSTDCPTGPDEILEGDRWGRLVPVGDTDRFAEALVDALRQGRWPEPPGAALERYTQRPVVEAYERVFLPLVQRAATHGAA